MVTQKIHLIVVQSRVTYTLVRLLAKLARLFIAQTDRICVIPMTKVQCDKSTNEKKNGVRME